MPRSTGDVQVGPTVIFGVTGQEASRGDGSSGTSADVCHIRKVAVEQALVLFPKRQAPGFVVGAVAGGQQFVGQVIVVGQ